MILWSWIFKGFKDLNIFNIFEEGFLIFFFHFFFQQYSIYTKGIYDKNEKLKELLEYIHKHEESSYFVLCFVFCVLLCFVMFYVLCFVFCVLCFVFCVLCFVLFSFMCLSQNKNESILALISFPILTSSLSLSPSLSFP